MKIEIQEADDDRTIQAIDLHNRASKRADLLRSNFGSAGSKLAEKYERRAKSYVCQVLTLRIVASIPKACDL